MANDPNNSSHHEDGFKRMSQLADADVARESNTETTGSLSNDLKSIGVDTDRMAEMANERVTEFQHMLADEIRARPFRALGWAAAAGLVVGFISAR